MLHREEPETESLSASAGEQLAVSPEVADARHLQELRRILDEAGIADNQSWLGRITRGMGIMGDDFTAIDEVENFYETNEPVPPETAVHFTARALQDLEPMSHLPINANQLRGRDAEQYTYAVGKLTQARNLRGRLNADYPSVGGKLVTQALEALTQPRERGTLITTQGLTIERSDAMANLLYAGNLEDVQGAFEKITTWASEQGLETMQNPQVVEAVDKLKARVQELQSQPHLEHYPLAA